MKNNSIALLVGVLIIISISIIVGPKQSVYLNMVTGHSTENSTVSFNMSQETSVLVTGAVNFGAGKVYSNASFAILDSSLGTGDSSYFGWANVTGISDPKPEPRVTNIVYDEARDVIIMYGGEGAGEEGWGGYYFDDTWQFNYSNKQWTNLTPEHSPGVAYYYGMTYDSSVGAVVMFRGDAASPCNPETWIFNSSGDWENVSPEISPAGAWYPMMAFDSSRNVTVMFGGYNCGDEGFFRNDTWEFNSSSKTWTNKTGAIAPPAWNGGGMAFDSDRNVMVIFVYNETWEYNGSDWVNVTALINNAPPFGGAPGMVYDSVRKKILLIGASNNETWEYNITDWVNASTFEGPRNAWQVVAFDSKINKTLLMYGPNNPLSFAYGDVQEYGNITFGGESGGGCINGTWSFSPSFIYVENDGTVNISIEYDANKNAGQFVGGTSPSFKIKGVVDESGACPDLNTTYADVSNDTPNLLCPLLKYQNNADRFKIPSRLIVPADVAAGEHNSTITLTATWVGGPA